MSKDSHLYNIEACDHGMFDSTSCSISDRPKVKGA